MLDNYFESVGLSRAVVGNLCAEDLRCVTRNFQIFKISRVFDSNSLNISC